MFLNKAIGYFYRMSRNTPEIYHQKMSAAFHTMIALPLAFFVYLFLEKKHNDLAPLIEEGNLTYLIDFGLTLISVILTFLAYTRFRKGLQQINRDNSLRARFKLYVHLTVKAYLSLGITFVLLVTGLFVTTSAIFIVDYVVLLFLLSLHRPTPDKYVRDLQLDGMDKKIVKEKREFID